MENDPTRSDFSDLISVLPQCSISFFSPRLQPASRPSVSVKQWTAIGVELRSAIGDRPTNAVENFVAIDEHHSIEIG